MASGIMSWTQPGFLFELSALKSICIIHCTTVLIDDLLLLPFDLLLISGCLNSKTGHQIFIIVGSHPV